MANTRLSLPTPTGPRPGAWPPQNAPQPTFNGWPTLNAPPAYVGTAPTMVAPIAQPALKPKPKARRFIAWSLCFFAGGLAAGPVLADYADQGLEAAIGWLATSAPGFLQPYLPKPLPAPTPPAPPPRGAGTAPETVAVAPVAAEPVADAPAPPKPTPEVAAPPPGTEAPAVVAAARPAPQRPAAQARPHRAQGTRRKIAAAEPEAREPKPKTRVAPAPGKSNPGKSGDSLDDLMGGGPSGSASRGTARRNTSKEIDAMLMGVQKSLPATPPKRAESAPPPPLTASDIKKAMAGVKIDAKACGKRFGQSGVADLTLTVGKDGRIAKAALGGELANRSFAQCVIKAARRAVFPRNAGLKFDYRIDVH